MDGRSLALHCTHQHKRSSTSSSVFRRLHKLNSPSMRPLWRRTVRNIIHLPEFSPAWQIVSRQNAEAAARYRPSCPLSRCLDISEPEKPNEPYDRVKKQTAIFPLVLALRDATTRATGGSSYIYRYRSTPTCSVDS